MARSTIDLDAPYLVGDPIPAPDVEERSSESAWALWNDAVSGRQPIGSARGLAGDAALALFGDVALATFQHLDQVHSEGRGDDFAGLVERQGVHGPFEFRHGVARIQPAEVAALRRGAVL